MATESLGDNFGQLAAHFRQMLNDLKGGQFFRSPSAPAWLPRVNLYESDEQFVVCVELPGMPREKIDVRVEDNILHIDGERCKPVLAEGFEQSLSVHQMEIDSGRFSRCIAMPGGVNVDQISAIYKNGFLWILLPRNSKG